MATARIARALRKYGGYRVYNAFLHKAPPRGETLYDGIIKLKKSGQFEKELAAFIRSNDIGVVVNMGRFFRQKRLRDAILESGRSVKLLFMHHFAPGSEWIKPTYKSGRHLLRLNPLNPAYWIRASIYPLLRMPRVMRLRKAYRDVYDMSDTVVLLSDGYKQSYADIAGLADADRLTAIPNVFPSIDAEQSQGDRQKRVLVLSRMDEIQKRISLALRIWSKIEREQDLSDWQLDIVGSGHDMKAIQLLSRQLGLRKVFFHGWKDSGYFLKRASILMMTSRYEGMPLTLLEAQAYGVVPIVYDSFASVSDVITDGRDGVMVEPFGDTDAFAERLAELMRDEEKRGKLSEAGKASAGRFSEEAIASKWMQLLEAL